MKLGLMPGNTVPMTEMKSLGFDAMQMFYGWDPASGNVHPSAQSVDETLQPGGVALAAMTMHIDLVGPRGCLPAEVDQAVRCVQHTATLNGRFGDSPKPILIWQWPITFYA